MKRLMLSIAILLLVALSSKAQYSLMTRGQLCPFDSAVAIRLDVYRLETQKLNLADTIINNLKAQLILNTQIVEELNKQLSFKNEIINIKDLQIADKDKTIESLTLGFYLQPKESWFKRNEKFLYFIGGLITGGGILILAN